jgi:hypothetical protein
VILRVSQVDYKKRGNFLNISILNATTGTNATSGDASGTNASDTSNVESSENIPASATEKAQEKVPEQTQDKVPESPTDTAKDKTSEESDAGGKADTSGGETDSND